MSIPLNYKFANNSFIFQTDCWQYLPVPCSCLWRRAGRLFQIQMAVICESTAKRPRHINLSPVCYFYPWPQLCPTSHYNYQVSVSISYVIYFIPICCRLRHWYSDRCCIQILWCHSITIHLQTAETSYSLNLWFGPNYFSIWTSRRNQLSVNYKVPLYWKIPWILNLWTDINQNLFHSQRII